MFERGQPLDNFDCINTLHLGILDLIIFNSVPSMLSYNNPLIINLSYEALVK